jgi:O-antigen/teichoic acid export membrane protein
LKIEKYINNVSSLQIFQLLRFGTLFLTGVFFSKSSLGIKDIGSYEILLFIAGSLSFFWVSGFSSSLLGLYNEKEENKSLFFNASILLLGFSAICFFIVRIFSTQISELISKQQEIPYLKIFSWYILISGPGFLIEYIYLLKNRSRSILHYGLIIFGIQLIVVVIPVYLGFTIEMSIYGLLFTAIVKLIWLIILLIKYSSFHLKPDLMKTYAFLAVPLILSTLLSGSAEYVDGFIVSHYFDRSAFAIFRFGARELPVTLLLANAFSSAMIPFVSSAGSIEIATDEIKLRSKKLMHLLFPISIVLLVLSGYLYPLIFNQNFKESATVFNVFLLLIISRMVFPQTILIGLKKTRLILFASLAEIIINVSFSLYLIQRLGLIGVAFGTVIAYFSEKIILMFAVYHVLKIKPVDYIPLRILLVYSCILLGVFLIMQGIGN